MSQEFRMELSPPIKKSSQEIKGDEDKPPLPDRASSLSPTQQHELLPCPFCGSEAAWSEDGQQKQEFGNDQAYCPNCYASAAPDLGKLAAAAWWNARHVGGASNAALNVATDIQSGITMLGKLFQLQDAANELADAVDAFMEAAQAGESSGVKIQTQYPVGESYVWRLKEKVEQARTLARKPLTSEQKGCNKTG